MWLPAQWSRLSHLGSWGGQQKRGVLESEVAAAPAAAAANCLFKDPECKEVGGGYRGGDACPRGLFSGRSTQDPHLPEPRGLGCKPGCHRGEGAGGAGRSRLERPTSGCSRARGGSAVSRLTLRVRGPSALPVGLAGAGRVVVAWGAIAGSGHARAGTHAHTLARAPGAGGGAERNQEVKVSNL